MKQGPLIRGVWTYLAATLSGVLYYLSFPGADCWPLAFITWTPWLLALRGASGKSALLQGLCLSLVTGYAGFYWLLEMLQEFSGFSSGVCFLIMTALLIYQGGKFSLMGWLVARGQSKGYNYLLVFVCAFVASETVWPLLFPFTFGASLHAVYPLIQIAEWGGPTLVALITVATSYACFRWIEAKLLARQAGESLSWLAAYKKAGLLQQNLLFSVPLWVGLYGMIRIVQVDAAVAQAQKLKVGIVQANMGLAAKRSDLAEGLNRHRTLTQRLKNQGVDLVVWSETSVAGAVPEEYAETHYRDRVTFGLNIPIMVGAVLSRDVPGPREFMLFNSALLTDRSGTLLGRYDKQFLLPFGEYLPFGEDYPELYEISRNSGRFSAGDARTPIQWGEHSIATIICYEDIIPAFVNQVMNAGGAELIVNMTNDAWFGDTSAPWEHMALSKMRSVEQRRFLVRATNSGMSGFVDPVGRLTKKTKTFEKVAIAEEVAWLNLWSPYRFIGDTPMWALSLLSFFAAFFAKAALVGKFRRPRA